VALLPLVINRVVALTGDMCSGQESACAHVSAAHDVTFEVKFLRCIRLKKDNGQCVV
jgi:hypothetical protein